MRLYSGGWGTLDSKTHSRYKELLNSKTCRVARVAGLKTKFRLFWNKVTGGNCKVVRIFLFQLLNFLDQSVLWSVWVVVGVEISLRPGNSAHQRKHRQRAHTELSLLSFSYWMFITWNVVINLKRKLEENIPVQATLVFAVWKVYGILN